ncbi:DUF4350 domain-containing protein [Microbacterium sp. JZ70]
MTELRDSAPEAAPARRGRRALGWIALVAGFVVFGLVLVLVAGREWSQRPALDAESAGPDGALAVTRLLEERLGVDVVIVSSLDEALGAVGDGTGLALGSTAPLADDEVERLVAQAGDTVLLAPTSRDLRILFASSGFQAFGDGTPAAPSCGLDVAVNAGDVVAGEAYDRGGADVACYPVADSGFALLQQEGDGRTVSAVDGASLLVNEHLDREGNAALALGLLAARDELVWYLPRIADAASTAPATLGELTPAWVTPAIVAAALAAVAAGIWRGRRFGPLVAEDLPVTVRANETLEGRARLYARASDAAHAARLLRAGASARMAVRLGLPRTAPPAEVADAAAIRLRARADAVRGILLAEPHDDASLVAFGERLHDLETAVDAAVRTERTPS